MKTALNEPLCKFLSDNFHMWDFPPVNLLEAIKRIAKTIKEDKKKNKEFSVLLMQKKNLINALGFSDEFF